MGNDADKKQNEELTEEEVAAQEGETLPDREVMSVLTLTPDQPVIGDWQPPPNMPAGNAIEPPPPTA